jgi:hypothetical protein
MHLTFECFLFAVNNLIKKHIFNALIIDVYEITIFERTSNIKQIFYFLFWFSFYLEMKLENKDSGRVQTNTTMNQSTSNQRDKSADIKDAKERIKLEKLQKEKEKKEREKQEKEREKQEKERKEREKKEKKEREKALKKGTTPPIAISGPVDKNKPVTTSATTSALNKMSKQGSGSSSELATPTMPSSKSENALGKFRKKENDSKWPSSRSQQQSVQQPQIPKGRYRYQVVYLDETVKTFDVDVSSIFKEQ